MNHRIILLVLIFLSLSPATGSEPNNAMKWLQTEESDPTLNIKEKNLDNKIPENEGIEKSTLKPVDINGIGIISTKITGIDPYLWREIEEEELFTELNALPSLKFHSAQTFLKRILISEIDPPIPSKILERSGKLYLFAKLDKLIEIGALDEAETTIAQIPELSREIFERWVKISLITGRLKKLCNTLIQNPGFTEDLSLRIICFKRLNDWDAAALTLSTASSLELLDQNREKLLIRYLDPSLIPFEQISLDFEHFTPADYFLLYATNNTLPIQSDNGLYAYMIFNKSSDTLKKGSAAEVLAINKSINLSSLFDFYRSNNISGSNEFWQRMIAIKDLDLTISRNNTKLSTLALNKAVDKMFSANLLSLFAVEYADKLMKFSYEPDLKRLNDAYAIVFTLNGEMPPSWKNFKSENKFLTEAINILNYEYLNSAIIEKAIKIVHPNLNINVSNKNRESIAKDKKLNNLNSKGRIILTALNKSSLGPRSSPEDLLESLTLFLKVKEQQLAKQILIEFLLHFSRLQLENT